MPVASRAVPQHYVQPRCPWPRLKKRLRCRDLPTIGVPLGVIGRSLIGFRAVRFDRRREHRVRQVGTHDLPASQSVLRSRIVYGFTDFGPGFQVGP